MSHRSTNESASNARHQSHGNARRTSHLGTPHSQQQQQQQQQQHHPSQSQSQSQSRHTQQSQSQSKMSSQQREKQESSGLPRSSRIEEAIALSDTRPSSSNFIKKNTSSLSPGNSEIKPKPFVVVLSNVSSDTQETEIESLIQQTLSGDSFKIMKVTSTEPAKVTIRIENFATSNKLVQALNGFFWKGSTLEAQLDLNATEKSSPSPGFSKGANEPFKPEFNRSYVPPQYRQPSLSRKNNSFYRPQRSTNSVSSSFDSRRSTTADSRASSHASSIFSNYSHRHSSNFSTISTGSVSEKQNLPSSIENSEQGALALGPEPGIEEGEEYEEQQVNEGDTTEEQNDEEQVNETDINEVAEEEFIEIPEGEGENPDRLIKVSPTRIFVGNVPYSSNWASLRKFLLDKLYEKDPENNVSILRVEIPISQMPLNEGLFYGQGGMGQPRVLSRSRGFAIVTTKDRASSEKLIELLNDVVFEGRALTIRYDKFPQFDNYIVQQLHKAPSFSRNNTNAFGGQYYNQNIYPSSQGYSHQVPPIPFLPQQGTPYNTHQKPTTNATGSSLLSNLAFERNSLQQKIYYRNTTASQQQPPYSTNTPVLQPAPAPAPAPVPVPVTIPPPPLNQTQNVPFSANASQNMLAAGYYYMPYYYQAPPPLGSSMYHPYGPRYGAEASPTAASDPLPSQYGDPNTSIPTFRPSGGGQRGYRHSTEEQQQQTGELFQNLSLNENK
ncbi:hypothetical protein KGF57_005013 [Candida theae]|uniref:RRM domain-containing protein n=1 Tax=Candida theae TaxID=1198502 RepID=A0AAD5BA87_9ASCO|nr:uncharacterized protein KGF57_005013 [Candida theae]KAI5948950.1 hypothetical protein KGF57_005013 [Candida theae]